ncbi:hypothetical protein BABA_06721 [Neobacillus bataviensis LMG 21833]|uniref:Uncharacterized protein n=1 Tax=Neobacillus bataviensis LMG 21833 TaxID=1117379 RepID=K6DP13_9BACI|nr:hypothetical protein BABA_06721 [Neobacillus bataviensis LMG 21833]
MQRTRDGKKRRKLIEGRKFIFMYHQSTMIITIFAFAITMALIFIRPKNMNEAIPATAGASSFS